MTVDRSGMLSGYALWWSADLGDGVVCSNSPSDPQRSWKQLVRWNEEPRFVNEGEELQVLACHNESQVNIDDIYMPKEVVDQVKAQMQEDQSAADKQAAAIKRAQGSADRTDAKPQSIHTSPAKI